MKILTGSFSGKKLSFRPNPKLRPTSDKVRMAIANVLRSCLAGARVLDLFSGTGALGFEALSMGARRAVFVEKNPAQAREIKENLEFLRAGADMKVITGDALVSLDALAGSGEIFDVVFADPPYGMGLAAKTLRALEKSAVLSQGVIIVIECGKREELPKSLGRLRCVKEKNYGDTRTLFFRQAAFESSA